MKPSEILTAAYRSAIADDGGYIVLIGDLMIDIWLDGQVDRQSPEDPNVPIFGVSGPTENSLGGAGLVYSHLKGMGVPRIKFITACGHDESYPIVAGLLGGTAAKTGGEDALFLAALGDRPTTTKLRAFDQHEKQRIRIDREDRSPLPADEQSAVIDALKQYIGQQCRLVVGSDYNKGLLTEPVMATIRDLCERRGVRWIADPAARLPEIYGGAYAICPNDREMAVMLTALLNAPWERAAPRWGNFERLHALDIAHVCLTRGHNGIALSTYDPPHCGRFQPWPVEAIDPIGAGDAVTAGLTLMLGGSDPAPMTLAAQFANMLGGWSVSQRRTGSPSREDVELLIDQADDWMVWPEKGNRQDDERDQPDVSA